MHGPREVTIRGSYSRYKLGRANGSPEPTDPPHDRQVATLNTLFLSDDGSDESGLATALCKKRSGYKAQDKKKDTTACELISQEDLIEKLVLSKLTCSYCRGRMKVVYAAPRDPAQWTLDRIDNSMGHSCANTVVACMACNLQRGARDADRFRLGKGLRVKRV